MANDDRIEVQFGASTAELDSASQRAAADVQHVSDATATAGQRSTSAWSGFSNVFKGASQAIVGGFRSVGESAQTAAQHVETAKHGVSGLGKAFAALEGPLLAVAAIAAGGAFFGEAISESNKLTGETLKLARTLGITAEEASTLNTALGDIYTDADTYTDAFQKFAMQLRRNEDGINEMGVKTRDANGHLRDSNTLFREALGTVGDYKSGLDQQTAAMTLFGKSVDDVMKLQKLNDQVLDDAREKNEQLGMTITQNNVEAMKAYKAAMNDVGDVFVAIKKTVGDAVMPVFTEIGQWFSQIGPAAVVVFKGAVGGLASLFHGVVLSVNLVIDSFKTLWNIGSAVFESLGEELDLFNQGRFMEMGGAARRGWAAVKSAYAAGENEMYDDARKAQEKILNLFVDGPAAKMPKSGAKTMGAFGDKSDKADKADRTPSYMGTYEAVLAERKLAYEKENNLRQMNKEEELAYWRDILSTYQVTSKDQVAIVRKTAELEMQVLREKTKRAQELKKEEIDEIERVALDGVQQEEIAAEGQVATWSMTRDQLIELQKQFEGRRYQIQAAAQAERIALMQMDPNADPVAMQAQQDKLLDLTRQYQLKRQQLENESSVQSMQIWQDLANSASSLWDKGIDAMMNGTLRWRNAVRAVGTELVGWFGKTVVKAMVTEWLAGETAKTTATTVGETIRRALGLAGLAASQSNTVADATTKVTAEAVKTEAGVTSAWAGTGPWGLAIGLALGAAAGAGIMGLLGRIHSAEGGFDIPRGMNPVTQLHQEEMVLPAQYANVIRGMAANGGAPASDAPAANIQLKGVSAGDFFIASRKELVAVLKAAHRDFSSIK